MVDIHVIKASWKIITHRKAKIIAGRNGICSSLFFVTAFLSNQNTIHKPLLTTRYINTSCTHINIHQKEKSTHARDHISPAIQTSPSPNHSVNTHSLRVCHQAEPR